MLFPYLASVSLSFVLLVNSAKIPIVNDIFGGLDSQARAQRIAKVQPRVVTTPGKLRNLVENSGICETTRGVYQASGYADIAADKSIFFWYFAARSNPSTSPLSLWFNGGPGSSSMFGLFQENGPCRITNDSSTVTSNQWSWNGASNMLYIDQPVGVGFSHGTIEVNSTRAAAQDIWKFIQIFLNDTRFQFLIPNKLGIWTESYGGHYGPAFAAYFLQMNQLIQNGQLNGTRLNLAVLGIGNGLTDPITQYPGYIVYANSANPYHVPLVSQDKIIDATLAWQSASIGCHDRILACNSVSGTDSVCASAQSYCNGQIMTPLSGNWNPYYVISPAAATSYPPSFTTYINSIASQIGAETTWVSTNSIVHNLFALTGDWVRTSIHDLETVIEAGVRVTIYNGDADYLCNFVGVESMLASLKTSISASFNAAPLSNWAPVGGILAGLFKTAGKLSYARIYSAGHEVPAYKYGPFEVGRVAWYVFSTTMADMSLFTTSSRLSASPLLLRKRMSTTTDTSSLLRYGENVTKGITRITPGIMTKGKGSYVEYDDGRTMLDFTCGIGVTNLGHCHPKISQAAADQCMNIVHAQCSIAFHEPYLRLIEKLLPIMPDASLDSFFFWNSGTEAIEASLRLARIITGKQNIICMQGAYHGRTFGSMAVTRSKTIYSQGVAPLMPGVFTLPFPFWHQLGLPPSTPEDVLVKQCLYQLDLLLSQQTAPSDTAAILIEPVIGEGGYVPAPPAFLQGLREVCDKHNILLIIDEVQSGFGRTGRFFAIEESGVRPDILVIAKGLANGFPLSGVISRREITDKLLPGSFGGTYAGNAVACAAATAVVDVMNEENILANVNARSVELFDALNGLKAAYPEHIVDVRGRGLMVAVEFASPTDTVVGPRPQLPKGLAARVAKKCIEKGMIILTTSVYEVVRFIPPLNISAEDLEKGAQIFKNAVAEVVREG
ncbi:Acetylornithine aminotransferase [Mycena indigotica]|uniref:Acetylornithine aminotransferase n=1 Tax=Mycena indigotica TaxID=2126181 RepID=A0A8H6S3X3_9AGAR|nr:Acetylornithine aminotransferase [Mycena indigotica]KAF7291967.1 Acetylornithine aminotransferase [Mycena indigotica]